MAFLIPNAVFIHIPKTGGQWIAAALERVGVLEGTVGPVHASPDELLSYPEFHARANVFAFVRHPLTWYQSMWAHRMDEEWEPIDDLEWFTPQWVEFWRVFSETSRSADFSIAVRNCLAGFPTGFVSELYQRYTERCTAIGKQEQLAGDLCRILTDFGISFDEARLVNTPRKNVRGRRPHRLKKAVYTPELVDQVFSVEKYAIERFGYTYIPDGLGTSGNDDNCD